MPWPRRVTTALREVPSLWDALPGGAAFGTLVHTVLEELDDPADEDAVRAVVAAQVARYAPGWTPRLCPWVCWRRWPRRWVRWRMGRRCGTCLGLTGCPSSTSSCRWPAATSRLAAKVLLADLVPLWREHCPTGLLSSYADVLADLAPAPLRGYLSGSIDAVLRVGPPESRRYLVVDYKTNRLGSRDEPLTAWHYRPSAMETAMVEAHYPLQALLYNVALHRYLRWRHPGYDPEVQLGGVLYLFTRGMCGPSVVGADGSVPGVFSWRPPVGLVTELSDLLAGLR